MTAASCTPVRVPLLAMLVVAALAIVLPGSARAAIPSAFDGQLECTVGGDGVRSCTGVIETFSGSPLDVNLFLPPEPESGPDGNFPIVGEFHGWGGTKVARGSLNRWLNEGFAAFSMSDRGWGESCGGLSPSRFTPACLSPLGGAGYNHLMDTRWEVRDAQHSFGLLADDGIISPTRIGVTGGSYGGGISMALSALKDRVMLEDGTLIPWESPEGTPMEIAAAAADIPWTDLGYSLMPNGRTLDYVTDSPYLGPNGDAPIGVMKQSFVTGLYGVGVATSNFALPRIDPSADVHTWYQLITAGEPYDENPLSAGIIAEVTEFHSSYYIDHSQPPAPTLISNGWTDDLFPPDEAIRFYNRTKDEYPGAKINLFFSDSGHQRGQNKGADRDARIAEQVEWLNHYVKGEGEEPDPGVGTITQVCGAASDGVFTAPTWAEISPGEIRFQDEAAKLISPAAGDPTVNQAYDPITGPGACATSTGADQPGLASYRLDPAPEGGFTLMGSPTIVADILSTGPTNQIAARLIDVDPETGDGTLVARGLYRPEFSPTAATRQVFQLHANGYKFEQGHIAKLELMPSDTPYGRISNGQLPITVSGLDLRLPVLEEPGTAGASEPAPKVLPDGYELSADYPLADADGDGVPDGDDLCVDEPGPPENDGCPLPPADADEDGTPDGQDACPDDPGPVENGGCPLTDTDGDGIEDGVDDCPGEPGPASNGGCPVPPPDSDGDGTPDASDVCPDLPGPAEADGCPPDRDFDGTIDSDDACPDQPGPADNSGCPIGVDPDPSPGPSDTACGNVMRGTKGSDRIKGTSGGDRIIGRAGDDRLRGKAGDDCIGGHRGKDRIAGGGGRDAIKAGGGRDRVNSVDGERDVVRCGKGKDRVKADEVDKLKGCEKVKLV